MVLYLPQIKQSRVLFSPIVEVHLYLCLRSGKSQYTILMVSFLVTNLGHYFKVFFYKMLFSLQRISLVTKDARISPTVDTN